MSLPHASQQQIDIMQREAEKKMRETGHFIEEESPAPVEEVVEEHTQESVEETVIESEPEFEEEPKSYEDVKKLQYRDLRIAKEKAEKDRDMLMQQILAFQQGQTPKPLPVIETPEVDPFANIDDEALVEGKMLKEMAREMKAMKQMLKGYEKQTKQTHEQTLEVRLRSQFPDMDKVLTAENIDAFTEFDPDLADTINNNPDMFKKATLAYKMIKQYGIYKENIVSPDKLQAQKNMAKPRPLASVSPQQGESPMSKANAFANGLTSDLKKQLAKEMAQYSKGM